MPDDTVAGRVCLFMAPSSPKAGVVDLVRLLVMAESSPAGVVVGLVSVLVTGFSSSA